MPLDYEKIKNWPFQEVSQRYSRRDTILYALGVGAGVDPLDPGELRFTYEKDLQALPTMGVVLALEGFWMADPRAGLDWRRMLHGEQSLKVHKPLAPEGEVVSLNQIDAIYDKGAQKGAILYMTRKLWDKATGDLLMEVGAAAFMRGDGGFGGSADGAPVPYAVPVDRAPDLSIDVSTRPDQALIYRLSGDLNPLHIDPALARSAGFDKPILHGLCSYGVAGRALLKLLCENRPGAMRGMNVRFATPVYPGETLRIEAWHTEPGTVAFRCLIKERNVVAINNGRFDYTAA